MHEDQASLFLRTESEPKQKWIQLHNCISDRGSKYSVTLVHVESEKDVKLSLAKLKEDKAYRKATHNSYAYRIALSASIQDKKADDGETGAGMAILRVLHRNTMVNTLVIVTRWFGGVKLHGDRFKHIVDATQLGLDQVKE